MRNHRANLIHALESIAKFHLADDPSAQVDLMDTSEELYARWNGAVAALTSVNPVDAAQVYVNVKRLFDEAYTELGYPNGDFDQAIVRAIRTLNATPDLTTEPVVLQRSNYIEYEDPALRGLLPVQKQLLLLGPTHRRAIMRWLHELARNLDLTIE